MKKEIEFIKEKIDKKVPKDEIRSLFKEEFGFKVNFDNCLEKALMYEQPKETPRPTVNVGVRKTSQELEKIRDEVISLFRRNELRAIDSYTVLNLCRLECDIGMINANKVFKR